MKSTLTNNQFILIHSSAQKNDSVSGGILTIKSSSLQLEAAMTPNNDTHLHRQRMAAKSIMDYSHHLSDRIFYFPSKEAAAILRYKIKTESDSGNQEYPGRSVGCLN